MGGVVFHIPTWTLLLGLTFVIEGCKPVGSVSDLTARRKNNPGDQIFRRIFERGPEGDLGVKLAAEQDYTKQLDLVLNSKEYDFHGFHRLQKKRLILDLDLIDESAPKQQTTEETEWTAIARSEAEPDYCGLKMEIADTLAEDRKGNYWSILDYVDKWVALPSFMTEGPLSYCYFGTPLKMIREEIGSGKYRNDYAIQPHVVGGSEFFTDSYTQPHVTDLRFRAQICALAVAKEFPRENDRDRLAPIPRITELYQVLKNAPGSDQALLDTEEGVKFVTAQLSDYYGFSNRRDVSLVGSKYFRAVNSTQCDFLPITATDLLEPAIRGRFPKVTRPVMAMWLKAKPSYVYMLARTAGLPGIHSSPFWLSNFRTNAKNRHLHRAKVIFDSHLCQEITPDTANFTNEKPIPPRELAPIFRNDPHAEGSKNCFDCHATIQPVGNLFWGLTHGRTYGQPPTNAPAGKVPPEMTFLYEQRYFSSEDALWDYPGGFWQWKNARTGEGRFLGGQTMRGIGGLGQIMRQLPAAGACVVRTTWDNLFQDLGKINPTDEQGFANVLAQQGFTQMIRAMFLSDKVKAALDQGAAPPAQATEGIDCANFNGEKADEDLVEHCGGCHDLEIEGDQAKISADANWEKYHEGTEAWFNIYCQVESGRMPQGGSDGFGSANKLNVMCRALAALKTPSLNCEKPQRKDYIHELKGGQ